MSEEVNTKNFGLSVGKTRKPYVYYQDITTYHPEWGGLAISGLEKGLESGANLQSISLYFQKMADVELSKEKNMIENYLGIDLEGLSSYHDQDFAKKLINAINTTFQIKEVFERNKHLIIDRGQTKQGEKSKYIKSGITYLHTYIQHYIDSSGGVILNALKTGSKQSLQQIFSECVRNGIKEFFTTSEVEDSIKSNHADEKNAYEKLVPFLYKQKGEVFIQQIYQNYGIDKLIEGLQESYNSNKDYKGVILDKGKYKGEEKETNYIHSIGGKNLEAFADFEHTVSFMLQDNLKPLDNKTYSNYGIRINSQVLGDFGTKPDVVINLGINEDIIGEAYAGLTDQVSRERNAILAKQVSDKMSKLKSGFIIYENAKNYTLGEDFQGRGFSAGSSITLSSFESACNAAGVDGNRIVTFIVNCINGAVLQGRSPDLEPLLARVIASMLFDDFNVVGQEQSGAQSIHIFNLNGILVPMSFFLNSLSQAFSVSLKNAQGLVKATITGLNQNVIYTPNPTYQATYESMNETAMEAWNNQIQVAKDSIKISYHFMKNFESLMQNVLK